MQTFSELASEKRSFTASDGHSRSFALTSPDLSDCSQQECPHSGLWRSYKERDGSWCGGVNSCVQWGARGPPSYKWMVFHKDPRSNPFPVEHKHAVTHCTKTCTSELRCLKRHCYQHRLQPLQEVTRAASHSCLSLFSFSLRLLQMAVSTIPLFLPKM